ncbi:MAG TPA: M23 family metallopeptidase [Myxococcales bacterium]|jgi:murein DD-endopeptidase MepM/ murein hydrolase activator NlpD
MFRKSARGLFDLLMAALAVSTLMTTTPLGELIGRGVRYSLGIPSKPTSLLSFFGSPGSQASVAALAAPETASLVSTVARAFGADPSVLKGFALASGADPSSPDLPMKLTPSGRELLVARGASESELSTGSGRLRAVSKALSDLTKELGSADAALCALVLGLQPVQYAAERVKAERQEPTLEAIASHLSPGSRDPVNQTVGLALQLATAYDLAWPVPRTLRVGSKFGMRVDPISRASALHNGVDIGMPVGTPIWSAGRGVIKRSGEDGMNGRYLVVDHGRGISSSYCHNSELLASRGSKVGKGETIANSGNTGRSTGPHLHYVVAIAGVAVDPLALFAESDRALVSVAVPAAPPEPPKTPVPAPTPTKVTPTPAKLTPGKAAPAPVPAKAGAATKKLGATPAKAAPAAKPVSTEPPSAASAGATVAPPEPAPAPAEPAAPPPEQQPPAAEPAPAKTEPTELPTGTE